MVIIYALNWDDVNFFNNHFSSITNLDTHHLILGGDFNSVLDPAHDCSSINPYPTSKSSKVVKLFVETYNYVDPWRFKFPNSRSYSFFSSVHNSFSRIDHFFIDAFLLGSIGACDYQGIVISDHSPLKLELALQERPPNRSWRFNPLLLSNPEFVTYVSNQIDTFLLTNPVADTSSSTRWEALKAFLRGQIISYTSHVNKLRKSRISDLTSSILRLDQQYAVNPTPDLLKVRIRFTNRV